MRPDGIECLLAVFVGVEAFVEELAGKTPGLRFPERVRVLYRDERSLLVLERRRDVSKRGKSETADHRALALIGQFICLPGLEAVLQVQGRGVWDDLSVRHLGELPLVSRDHARAVVDILSHSNARVRTVGIDRQI